MQVGSLHKLTPHPRISGGFSALYTKVQIWVQKTSSIIGVVATIITLVFTAVWHYD